MIDHRRSTSSVTGVPAHSGFASAGYAWYMVILLTLAYVLAFIDRYILGLLVEPIKADLQLSDTGIGLLLGPAFALFYATMGLPLGWLADRTRRNFLVGAGIAVWSFATAACGLARNFAQLFLARVAVGVGEATLGPCALSMISDSFPPNRRGRPIAFYTTAISLGAGLASLAGATVLAWARAESNISLPLAGSVAPWQFAFIVVGLGGLPVAMLVLFLREPRREHQFDAPNGGPAGVREALRFVCARRGMLAGFSAIVCVMTIVAYSHGWLPAMFSRTWGWPAEKYALVNGIALLCIGPPTVNVAGWLSDHLAARGRDDAPLLIMIAGLVMIVPTAMIAPLMPTAITAYAVFCVNTIGAVILSATAPTALLNITPGRIRGQVVALYYMVISIAGLLLGPTSVGLLADNIFGAEGLRYAVAVVPLVFGVLVLLAVIPTRRRYLTELATLENRGATASQVDR